MSGNSSKISEQPDTLMAMAAYIKLARQYGAQHHASVISYDFGASVVSSVTLRFQGNPTDAELAAWMNASGQAWETVSYTFGEDKRYRHTEARIRFQGAEFAVSVEQPAEALTAVAA